MKRLRFATWIMSTAVVSLAAGEAVYLWTAAGATDAWNNCDNWNKQGTCLEELPGDSPETCFPGFPCHDAIIPQEGAAPWEVNMITADINALAIAGSTNLNAPSGSPTLTVKRFTVQSLTKPATVTVDSNAVITIEP